MHEFVDEGSALRANLQGSEQSWMEQGKQLSKSDFILFPQGTVDGKHTTNVVPSPVFHVPGCGLPLADVHKATGIPQIGDLVS